METEQLFSHTDSESDDFQSREVADIDSVDNQAFSDDDIGNSDLDLDLEIDKKESSEGNQHLNHEDLLPMSDTYDIEAANKTRYEQEDKDDSPKVINSLPTQEEIFGEELDVSSEEEEERTEEDTEQILQNQELEVAEEGKEESVEEGVAIEIELPAVNKSIGDDIFFVKLPNFLSIETKPFDPLFYEDEIDDDEVLDEEGRARLKLKVENTIRWRKTKDSDQLDVRESNARIVRWSDGSLSLHMGNEIFDIFKMPIEGLQNHLFVQQGTGLQAKSVFKEKLTFRPYSTRSQTHLKMTMSIADRVSKSQKIRLIPVTERDPEAARQEMTKKEEERIRAQLRRESQQRRMREKSHSKGLTAGYLESERYEDDEQELEESLAAIKSKYKKDIKAGRSRNVRDVYSDEDSDGNNQVFNANMNVSSDEEGPRGAKRKPSLEDVAKKKKMTRKIIESDDESE